MNPEPSDRDRRAVWEDVRADLFGDVPDGPQVLLSVGAQPGAGKTAARGASTHLIVLAVPAAVSWQGCVSRYVHALEAGNNSRWTPLDARDTAGRWMSEPEAGRFFESLRNDPARARLRRLLKCPSRRSPSNRWRPTGQGAFLVRSRAGSPRWSGASFRTRTEVREQLAGLPHRNPIIETH